MFWMCYLYGAADNLKIKEYPGYVMEDVTWRGKLQGGGVKKVSHEREKAVYLKSENFEFQLNLRREKAGESVWNQGRTREGRRKSQFEE